MPRAPAGPLADDVVGQAGVDQGVRARTDAVGVEARSSRRRSSWRWTTGSAPTRGTTRSWANKSADLSTIRGAGQHSGQTLAMPARGTPSVSSPRRGQAAGEAPGPEHGRRPGDAGRPCGARPWKSAPAASALRAADPQGAEGQPVVGAGDDVRPAGHRHDDHPAERIDLLPTWASAPAPAPPTCSSSWAWVLIWPGSWLPQMALTPPQVLASYSSLNLHGQSPPCGLLRREPVPSRPCNDGAVRVPRHFLMVIGPRCRTRRTGRRSSPSGARRRAGSAGPGHSPRHRPAQPPDGEEDEDPDADPDEIPEVHGDAYNRLDDGGVGLAALRTWSGGRSGRRSLELVDEGGQELRAPEQPSGWPRAMAPPLTLVLARSEWSSFSRRARLARTPR